MSFTKLKPPKKGGLFLSRGPLLTEVSRGTGVPMTGPQEAPLNERQDEIGGF